MSAVAEEKVNGSDHDVDQRILACLNIERPRSFFLFAGAGSGKTRSLVTTLGGLRAALGRRMRLHGQQVAVITYTNAACDEIKRRLDFDPLVSVSTIHSFVWDLIQGFNTDIRSWLSGTLKQEITELEALQRKGRAGSQAAADRARSIEASQRRLETLPSIKRFIYNPNGENRGRDSLNHSEVIKIGASFLTKKPLMQELLIRRFPILLIDESQDTNRLLMESFLLVQGAHKACFSIGLFGDTMQRIYADGKVDLGRNLPEDWDKPEILVNHRCPRRIVKLINKIRSAVDFHQQRPKTDAIEGHVRLFIAPVATTNKQAIEEQARRKMAEVTGDERWRELAHVKALTLEHHMAAKRMGFLEMFDPLDQIDDFSNGLRDGTLPVLRFFTELVLPLVVAKQDGNEFAATAVIRRDSPLLQMPALQAAGADQLSQVKAAKKAVEALLDLFSNGAQPRFLDVLQCAAQNQLFEVPDLLLPFARQADDAATVVETAEDDAASDEAVSKRLAAIRSFLNTPFSQIKQYAAYVKGKTPCGTHQGVKGLEYPRVMIVIDDEEARGFLFSYEKLFGAKDKTSTDLKNEREGKETGIERTRRLFYVTCSRTQSSLAIIAYTSNPDKVREHAVGQGWFESDEIEFLT
jgi:DNA helicase II / ATP-dependent DNA helicase PcrA